MEKEKTKKKPTKEHPENSQERARKTGEILAKGLRKASKTGKYAPI